LVFAAIEVYLFVIEVQWLSFFLNAFFQVIYVFFVELDWILHLDVI